MKEPKISQTVTGYNLVWEEAGLTVQVGRLNTHNDGRLTGELQILNHESILLPTSQMNFASDRTRSQQAKQLAIKYPGVKVDWVELFDYLGYKVQLLVRSGDGVTEVWAQYDAPAPEKMLDPVIYKGTQNIIFGEKGVNKSTLCYLFGVCVTLPWYDNPFGLVTHPNKSTRVLVLDWETEKSIFEYYLSRMQRGMGMPACGLFYRRCHLPLVDDIEAIERYIAETKAELLIIDSLGAAAGGESGELKGSQSALMFNSALRKLKITSLIIGQTSKGQPGDNNKRKSIFGSTYFEYYARNIFELCKSDDEENKNHLALFHRFCNLGRKHQPMGFCVTYDDSTEGIKIEREAVSMSEFSGKISTSSRILELLKSGPLTQKELTESLEVSYAALGMALKRISNKVVKLPDKKIGLLSNEKDL